MELKLIDKSTADTLALIETLDDVKATKLPEKGWSALQVLEHIVLVDNSVLALLLKPRVANLELPKEHFGAEKLRGILIDTRSTSKIESPEAFHPRGLFKNLNEVKKAFEKIRNNFKNVIESGELVLDGAQFKHPRLGEMTVRDWLNFIALHNERHLEQIKQLELSK